MSLLLQSACRSDSHNYYCLHAGVADTQYYVCRSGTYIIVCMHEWFIPCRSGSIIITLHAGVAHSVHAGVAHILHTGVAHSMWLSHCMQGWLFAFLHG